MVRCLCACPLGCKRSGVTNDTWKELSVFGVFVLAQQIACMCDLLFLLTFHSDLFVLKVHTNCVSVVF